MKRAVDPSISADALGSEPTARRVTDQIDPYALIDRAERLLNTNPHDAVMFALRAQSVARARGAEALMARAHYVVGAALAQTGDWSGAIRQLSHAEHIYRAQNDIASQCQVIMQLAAACSELGEYPEALDGFAQAERLARQHRDHAAVRRALVQTSSVHTVLGDFTAARECLRSALELPSGTAADEGMVVLQFGLVDVNEGLKAALAGDAQTVTRRMAEGEEHFDVALELLSGTTDLSTADRGAHAARRGPLLDGRLRRAALATSRKRVSRPLAAASACARCRRALSRAIT